jgi:hypothetical protein
MAERLDLTLLLTVKMEKSLINLVGTGRPTIIMAEWQFIFP